MMLSIVDLLSCGGVSSKTKIVYLGSADTNLLSWVRSLNLEHVSPTELMRLEISRRRSLTTVTELTFAAMRRWFFARKPDAGFVLTDFPATLLQAKVFDEWLDTRSELLTGVASSETTPVELIEHYRTLGLHIERPELASL
jgi:adenylate kinase